MFNFFANIFHYITFLVLHITNPNSTIGSGAFPKPLAKKEEQKYLELMCCGDKNARNKLIEHNLRLVVHIVKKYYNGMVDQDDLVSVGTIGLIKAIDSFNLEKGIRLSSYAARCIENEVLMFFRSGKKTALEVSLNEPLDNDKDSAALVLMDTVCVEDSIIDELDLRFKTEKIYNFIEKNLDEREKNIIKMRYGLNGQKPLTQREVAKILNISRSYVSRIEKNSLLSIRKFFKDNNL